MKHRECPKCKNIILYSSDVVRNKQETRGSLCHSCSNKKYRSGKNAPMYGKHLSEEQKEKLSISNRGQIRTKETRKNISKSLMGRKLSEEHKKKISIGNIGRVVSEKNRLRLHKLFSGNGNPAKRDAVRKKISKEAKSRLKNKENHPMYGKHHSPETIEKLRMAGKTYIGKKNGMYGKTHTPEAIKKIFAHHKMNKLEKIVADTLDAHKIKYTFQFFISKNGICKSYDFKIKRKPILIEVDGDFWHGNPDTKHHVHNVNEVRQNDKFKNRLAKTSGYTVIHLWESDIEKNPNIIIEKLHEFSI